MFRLILACSLAAFLLVASTVAPVLAQAPAAKQEPTGVPQEGIAVHGHWAIEVRNPDGTLVSQREFENAFVGAETFVWILGRRLTVGRWAVRFVPVIGTVDPTQQFTEYATQEPGGPFGIFAISNDLQVSVVGVAGGKSFGVKLTGSLVHQTAAWVLDRVRLELAKCINNAPAVCGNSRNGGLDGLNGGEPGDQPFGPITEAPLAPPISVAAGQIVTVTVILSLS